MSRGHAVDQTPLKVAFLSPWWPADGAENGIASYVERMVESFRRLGHRAIVISAGGDTDRADPDVYFLAQENRRPLARVFDGIAFRWCGLRAFRSAYARNLVQAARRAVAERAVQLIEMEETFGLAQLVKPKLRIPVVIRLHGPHFIKRCISTSASEPLDAERVRREGIGIARADAVSSVSADILEKTRVQYGLSLGRAVVIPNPAPIVPAGQRWRLPDCIRERILFVGRFDRNKGGDVVVDCMRILLRRFPTLRLWFVGSDRGFVDEKGTSWSFPQYVAERAPGAAEHIDWLGKQPATLIGELRRKAALTVVASRYETFGLVALEAMAHGSPLVATRAGGIAESVVDGENGLLCRPADPEHMAVQIGRLLADPELATKLGQRAAEDAVTRFHPDVIARQTASFYRQVLEERHTKCP